MAVINTPVVVSVCHVMRSLEAVVEIRPESARRSRTLTSGEEPQIFFFSLSSLPFICRITKYTSSSLLH